MSKISSHIRLNEIMRIRRMRQTDVILKAEPYCKQYGIKLGKSTLSQYLSGKVEPSHDKLYILGLVFNVSEAWLMGYDVPMERVDNYAFDYTNEPSLVWSAVEDYYSKMSPTGAEAFAQECLALVEGASKSNKEKLSELIDQMSREELKDVITLVASKLAEK